MNASRAWVSACVLVGLLTGTANAVVLSIASSNSVKTHGTSGTYAISSGSVEGRLNGPTTIVTTFNQSVHRVTGTAADFALSSGTLGTVTVAGAVVTVNMSGVTDRVIFTIGFPGIASDYDSTTTTATQCWKVLQGDANGISPVNNFDVLAIRGLLGQVTGASNFTRDVNCYNGRIDNFDILFTRSKLGHSVTGTCASGGLSGQTVSGCIDTPSDQDIWTFSGTAGQRVRIVVSKTLGDMYPQIVLYPPGGGAAEASSGYSAYSGTIDHQLSATGSYTIVVLDGFNGTKTGCYDLTFLNLSGALTSGADPDGGPIESGQTVGGVIGLASDMDAFTFSGTAGQRVRIVVSKTSGDIYPQIILYPPDGEDAEAVSGYSAYSGTIDRQLSATGSYTIVVLDGFNGTKTGGYDLTFLNLSGALTSGADPDGGPINSGQTVGGVIDLASDMDAFRFPGTTGQRVRIVVSKTSGDIYPQIILYPPGGGDAEAFSGYSAYSGTIDRQLSATGSYTIVVLDGFNGTKTGGYDLTFLNLSGALTSGADPDGGPIDSGQTVGGVIGLASDMDAFTFSGTAGQRARIVVSKTSGDMYPQIVLYPPGGGAAEASSGYSAYSGTIDRQLSATGSYTIVVLDGFNGTRTGGYNLTLQEF